MSTQPGSSFNPDAGNSNPEVVDTPYERHMTLAYADETRKKIVATFFGRNVDRSNHTIDHEMYDSMDRFLVKWGRTQEGREVYETALKEKQGVYGYDRGKPSLGPSLLRFASGKDRQAMPSSASDARWIPVLMFSLKRNDDAFEDVAQRAKMFDRESEFCNYTRFNSRTLKSWKGGSGVVKYANGEKVVVCPLTSADTRHFPFDTKGKPVYDSALVDVLRRGAGEPRKSHAREPPWNL